MNPTNDVMTPTQKTLRVQQALAEQLPTSRVVDIELDEHGDPTSIVATHEIPARVANAGYRRKVAKVPGLVLGGRWHGAWDQLNDTVQFDRYHDADNGPGEERTSRTRALEQAGVDIIPVQDGEVLVAVTQTGAQIVCGRCGDTSARFTHPDDAVDEARRHRCTPLESENDPIPGELEQDIDPTKPPARCPECGHNWLLGLFVWAEPEHCPSVTGVRYIQLSETTATYAELHRTHAASTPWVTLPGTRLQLTVDLWCSGQREMHTPNNPITVDLAEAADLFGPSAVREARNIATPMPRSLRAQER